LIIINFFCVFVKINKGWDLGYYELMNLVWKLVIGYFLKIENWNLKINFVIKIALI